MSFFSSLMATAVLPTDLVNAGVVGAADRVYSGRRPEGIQRAATEVWVEELPMPRSEGWGIQNVKRYQARIHVRALGNSGGSQTGEIEKAVVEAHLETLRDRYNGEVLFVSTFAGMLPADAFVEAIDLDPDDEKTTDGVLNVTFSVKE